MFDFGKNGTVDALEKVPEDFRGLYVEDGEKFKLDTEDAKVKSAVSAIQKLNTSLKAARSEAAGWKGKSVDLSALAEYGTKPEEILDAFNAKMEEVRNEKLGTKAEELKKQVEKVRADMTTAHKAELDKLKKDTDSANNALKSQLFETLATKEVHKAFAGKLITEDADIIVPHVLNQLSPRVDPESGKYNVYVVDPAETDPTTNDKVIRFSGTTGKPMTIAELAVEMEGKDQWKPLFKSRQPAGGGTPPGGGRQITRTGGSDKTPNQKISAGLAARGVK